MRIPSRSPQETFEFGRSLGARCRGGEVFALSGPLGAGKTVFAKGLAAGLGIDPDKVTSPTFVLMTVHRGRLAFAHADAYRVEDAEAFARDGWEDFAGGVRLAEWGERFDRILPADAIRIRIRPLEGEAREIAVEGLPAHLRTE